MSPTQNFPSMGGKRLCHYPHKISPPWEESNVILCNYIYNPSSIMGCNDVKELLIPEMLKLAVDRVQSGQNHSQLS